MKTLHAELSAASDMTIKTSNVAAWSYMFTMLCSTVYWLRVSQGVKRDIMPKALLGEYRKAVTDAEPFLKQFKIPVKPYRAYTAYIADRSPTEDEPIVWLSEHLKSMHGAKASMLKDHSIADVLLAAMTKVRLWHKSETVSNLEWIRGKVTELGMPAALIAELRSESESQVPYLAELKTLCKKLCGKTNITSIPMEQRADIREKYPEEWKRYLALHKKVLEIFKQELRDYIRQKGGPQDIAQTIKYFEAKNMHHKLHRGFKGKVGEAGELYTMHGDLITGNPDMGSKIEMNPNYDPAKDKVAGRNGNYVMTVTLPTVDAKGVQNVQHVYTAAKNALNREAKFGIITQLIEIENKLVARWRKDLIQRTDDDKQVLATIMELMYETCARIGGKDNENKKGVTQGLTTLTVGNLKRQGPNYILDYIGKDSVHFKHKIAPTNNIMKAVIRVMDSLTDDKKRADLLFEWDGTEYNAAMVRAYFKTICPIPGATPHKIRHLRGTRLAITELGLETDALNARKTIAQTNVDAAFKDALTRVGKLLGHVRGVGATEKATWSTAAKNYISPDVMTGFYDQFKDKGVRIPAFLKTIT